jgi:predicted dehydrogenase
MTQPLRVGLIGTGVAARLLHWPTLSQMPERYRLVAVANRTLAKAEALAAMAGLGPDAVYRDYQDLLGRHDLDVVLLALPPEVNYEVARAAAETGLDIICEKPIAATLEDGQAMATLSQEFGVRLLIAENFRYDAAVQKARALLDAGRIGPPFMISYRFVQPVPPDDEIAGRPWRQNPSHAGGIFSDHGVHMIDVVRYLMGEVAAVQVFGRELRRHVVGVDTAVYNLEFESGAVGSMQWSFAIASAPGWSIQLWADNGTLEVTPDGVRLHKAGQPDELFPIQAGQSFVNEFADFYEALVHGRQPVMTVGDALVDLRTIFAAHQAVESGAVVRLDKVRADEARG